MPSPTDRIVRALHDQMRAEFGDAGEGEILDHLAWEVGAAASELVHPARWVAQALVSSGACANASEAHARIVRIVSQQVGALEMAVPFGPEPESRPPQPVRAPDPDEIRRWARRCRAVALMEERLPAMSLPLQARLESCPRHELDQAATTTITLALDNGDPDIVEDVVVSLLLFSEDWRATRFGRAAGAEKAKGVDTGRG